MRGVCDVQIEIGDLDFGLGFDTPCHAYGKGGGSLRAFRRAIKRTKMDLDQFGRGWND